MPVRKVNPLFRKWHEKQAWHKTAKNKTSQKKIRLGAGDTDSEAVHRFGGRFESSSQDLGDEGEDQDQVDKEDSGDSTGGDRPIGSTEGTRGLSIPPPIPRGSSFYPQHLPPLDKDNHDDFGFPLLSGFALFPDSWFYKQWAKLVFGSIIWCVLDLLILP